ncbi:hypothetical protein [Allocoleopsis sp.]|uniref:hypothetical protein n=1 Tax=Allocoleopsis sp. TaxID=3088169 RepID=UPI002FD5A546
MRDYILYHAGCYDGFGGAYVAWKCFGNKAHYLPVRHGNPPPEIPENSQVYIIDFCYAKQILLEMLKRHRVTVLDHHRSEQLPLEELREEAIRSMADNRDMGFRVEFDLNRSGAMLAWNHFYPEEPAPELIHYIQDRDLQRFSLPDSQEVFYALCGYPMDFEVWDTLSVEQLRVEGKAIAGFATQTVNLMCTTAVTWLDIAGYRIPAVNASCLFLEVKAKLCELYPEAPFVAYYFDRSDGKRQWGLRSVGEFDVSEVARQLGGGGHKNDAGFTVSLGLVQQ